MAYEEIALHLGKVCELYKLERTLTFLN